ncbi:MAG: molybdopterin-guanine dinucleotide biosynthesis protein B [Planctomycetaceae bacterium]
MAAEFHPRSVRVGTIKHTRRQHELDAPGWDPHRHRASAAAAVGILTRSQSAVFWTPPPAHRSVTALRRKLCGIHTRVCRMRSGSGRRSTAAAAPRLEVWRAALDNPPIAARIDDMRAIVADDAINSPLPIVRRTAVAAVADLILRLLGFPSGASG